MLAVGNNIQITLETKEPPYSIFGIFKEQDDEFVEVTSTHGDSSGNVVLVPKNRIKMITVLS